MDEKIEVGIDEAGRGCVLGPLVMAGVWVKPSSRHWLEKWNVNDSKAYGSAPSGKALREKLAEKIKARFSYQIVSLEPELIDRYVRKQGLNRLEQETALNILQKSDFDLALLDGENLFKPITDLNIIAKNKADRDHLSVAAASILAKDKRDRELESMLKPYEVHLGPIRGGGYPNAQTLLFLKWFLKQHGTLPAFYRKSYQWKAMKETLNAD
ncbi:MAG: hypothetical protein OEY59_03250 [Deltaproteobacteria bacterium]|nr:hypothetical protein [Deltaproteobacteria bacterium]